MSELSGLRTLSEATRDAIKEHEKGLQQALAETRELRQALKFTSKGVEALREASSRTAKLLEATIPEAFSSIESRIRDTETRISAAVGSTAATVTAATAEIGRRCQDQMETLSQDLIRVTERQRVVETPMRARRRGSRAEVSGAASGLEDAKKRAHPRGGSSARDDSAEEETRNDGGDESYESAETTPEVALVAPVAPRSFQSSARCIESRETTTEDHLGQRNAQRSGGHGSSRVPYDNFPTPRRTARSSSTEGRVLPPRSPRVVPEQRAKKIITRSSSAAAAAAVAVSGVTVAAAAGRQPRGIHRAQAQDHDTRNARAPEVSNPYSLRPRGRRSSAICTSGLAESNAVDCKNGDGDHGDGGDGGDDGDEVFPDSKGTGSRYPLVRRSPGRRSTSTKSKPPPMRSERPRAMSEAVTAKRPREEGGGSARYGMPIEGSSAVSGPYYSLRSGRSLAGNPEPSRSKSRSTSAGGRTLGSSPPGKRVVSDEEYHGVPNVFSLGDVDNKGEEEEEGSEADGLSVEAYMAWKRRRESLQRLLPARGRRSSSPPCASKPEVVNDSRRRRDGKSSRSNISKGEEVSPSSTTSQRSRTARRRSISSSSSSPWSTNNNHGNKNYVEGDKASGGRRGSKVFSTGVASSGGGVQKKRGRSSNSVTAALSSGGGDDWLLESVGGEW